ncbi:MAG TPA: hypothetical protein VKA34_19595 [Balneolales bacterium]|nr:hypothetical protein [Balneolales bacterium]
MNLDYILLLFAPILIMFLIAIIGLIFDKKEYSEDLLEFQKQFLKENPNETLKPRLYKGGI